MASPARRHFLRHAAEQSAVASADFGSMKNASIYELQLFQLSQDRARLKQIQSTSAKVELKRKLVPEYAPYIEGVLAADKGGQDDIVTTIMLWRIDIADYLGALQIGAYAIKHSLTMPDRFQRPTPNIIAEEIANAALAALKIGSTFDLPTLQQTYELVKNIDLHDQIICKLHLAIGKLALQLVQQDEVAEQAPELALVASQHLTMALELNSACGAKTALSQAAKLAEKLTVPAEQQASSNNQPLLLTPNGSPVVDDFGDQVADYANQLNQALGGNPLQT